MTINVIDQVAFCFAESHDGQHAGTGQRHVAGVADRRRLRGRLQPPKRRAFYA